MQLVLRRTFSQSFDAPPPAPPTQTPPSRNSYSKVGAAFLKKQKVYRCGTRWKHLLLLLLKGDSEAKLRLNEETINCKRSKSPTQSLCHADTLCVDLPSGIQRLREPSGCPSLETLTPLYCACWWQPESCVFSPSLCFVIVWGSSFCCCLAPASERHCSALTWIPGARTTRAMCGQCMCAR